MVLISKYLFLYSKFARKVHEFFMVRYTGQNKIRMDYF